MPCVVENLIFGSGLPHLIVLFRRPIDHTAIAAGRHFPLQLEFKIVELIARNEIAVGLAFFPS